MNKEIFREYDIRGDSKYLDDETVYKIGRGYGSKLREYNKNVCVVGHDNRLSSKRIVKRLLKGITDSGIDVVYIGLTTTPMHNFAMQYLKVDCGMMVTASHNPTNDNGFKFSYKDYNNVFGEAIKEFYDYIVRGDFYRGFGTVSYVNVKQKYIDNLVKDIKINRRFRIAVDAGNGTTSMLIRDVFKRFSISVMYLNDVSDGSFPNHHPDPFDKKNMVELSDYVKCFDLDLGISFDGDGDRVGFVDDLGNILDIDRYMALMCRNIIPKSDNKTVLFDVKCSRSLEDEILRLDGTPYMYRTGGNTYVKNKIKEMNLPFGGELSGHVIFRDKYIGVDDGIYAALRLLEFLSDYDESISMIDNTLTRYYKTPELKIESKEDTKFKVIEKIKETTKGENASISYIDGIRIDYSDGWALVRASNTGPNLTLRFEANTLERLNELKDKFISMVDEYNK